MREVSRIGGGSHPSSIWKIRCPVWRHMNKHGGCYHSRLVCGLTTAFPAVMLCWCDFRLFVRLRCAHGIPRGKLLIGHCHTRPAYLQYRPCGRFQELASTDTETGPTLASTCASCSTRTWTKALNMNVQGCRAVGLVSFAGSPPQIHRPLLLGAIETQALPSKAWACWFPAEHSLDISWCRGFKQRFAHQQSLRVLVVAVIAVIWLLVAAPTTVFSYNRPQPSESQDWQQARQVLAC